MNEKGRGYDVKYDIKIKIINNCGNIIFFLKKIKHLWDRSTQAKRNNFWFHYHFHAQLHFFIGLPRSAFGQGR